MLSKTLTISALLDWRRAVARGQEDPTELVGILTYKRVRGGLPLCRDLGTTMTHFLVPSPSGIAPGSDPRPFSQPPEIQACKGSNPVGATITWTQVRPRYALQVRMTLLYQAHVPPVHTPPVRLLVFARLTAG